MSPTSGVIKNNHEAIRGLLHRVDSLAAHGSPVPRSFTLIRKGAEAIAFDSEAAQDELLAAVIDGRTKQIPDLAVKVHLAESVDSSRVRRTIDRRVLEALKSAWREGSKTAYARIASEFDRRSAAFHKAADTTDVLAAAEEIVGLPKNFKNSLVHQS